LAHAVSWNQSVDPVSQELTDYCLRRLADETQHHINRVIDNYPSSSIRLLLRPMRCNVPNVDYDEKRNLINLVNNHPDILKKIREDIYHQDGILAELEQLNTLDNESEEYKNLYQKVIQVGEYPNA
jgi:hypothetical protein